LAVARAESGVSAATDKEVVLNPRAVSPDGKSAGLFQLTAETGQAQLQKLALRQAYNPFNPHQSIHLGVSYLKYLATAFSTETALQQDLRTTPGADPQEVRRLAVAAYNAGEGRVARAQLQARDRGGNPARYQDVAPYLPETTQNYVERVERFAADM
jgi:membrane-bound lytic murein transglycosylase MltF